MELCLWLGQRLGSDFHRVSDMCSARTETINPAATVSDLMSDLAARYPLVAEKVFDPKRKRFNSQVVVTFNDRVVNPKTVHQQVLKDGDKITVLPIYSGG